MTWDQIDRWRHEPVVFSGMETYGLYGLVSHVVRQRTREIGIRIAPGADRGRVSRPVLKEAVIPTAFGASAGLGGAWWLSRYLSTLLYHTRPHDPAALLGVVGLLVALAAVAAYLPARRTARINPIETPRAE